MGGILCYLLPLPFLVLSLAALRFLMSFFTSDPAVMALGEAGLRLPALILVVMIAAEIWGAAVAGTGDTTAIFVIEVISALFMLASAFVAGFTLSLGVTWVWGSLLLGSVITLSHGYVWLKLNRWRRLSL